MQKPRLGRGLDALLPKSTPTVRESAPEPGPMTVHPSLIIPNPNQPRRIFDEARIDELARSIEDSGILQPLVVRTSSNGYELIAGERRLRAAQRLGLPEVPVIIHETVDPNTLLLALIENLQREDLNPIEEAAAFAELQEQFNLTQEQVAGKVGRSRSAVANSLRLLSLPDDIKQHVARGELPAGQARALLALENRAMLAAAVREVMAKDLSTRETEALVKRLKSEKRPKTEHRLDPDLANLVETLQRRLGTRVRLMHRARDGKGKLEIEYYSQDDLGRITDMVMGKG
ncbi:MAG: ParB/RepB/Spo0J family partition protein [Deltaproteobacteria bacterium]|nr:ParB/RepB/Spo0J family partition protein [Deltaproteobacteria bacterium]